MKIMKRYRFWAWLLHFFFSLPLVAGVPTWATIISTGLVCTFYTTLVRIYNFVYGSYNLQTFPFELLEKLIYQFSVNFVNYSLIAEIKKWNNISRLSGKKADMTLDILFFIFFAGWYEGSNMDWCVSSRCHGNRSHRCYDSWCCRT